MVPQPPHRRPLRARLTAAYSRLLASLPLALPLSLYRRQPTPKPSPTYTPLTTPSTSISSIPPIPSPPPSFPHTTTASSLDSSPALPVTALDAVVKIFATHCTPNHALPWQMRAQRYTTSTGFAIPGHRIVTNAHSVLHATVVRVKRRGSDMRWVARVVAVGEECDLAVLEVVDVGGFWEGMGVLELGEGGGGEGGVLSVVGYPVGGEGVAVTTGVVSRVELRRYMVGGSALLVLQTSAAINHGNSGGPALDAGGRVVGVAFQMLRGGGVEGIGYLIAVEVLRGFLRGCEREGGFKGFCHPGFAWQSMENDALRRAMSGKGGRGGILVREVSRVGGAAAVLKVGDIVTEVNGVEVSSMGTVPFHFGDRIDFNYALMGMNPGEEVRLRVIRGRKERDVVYPLAAGWELFLVPCKEDRKTPRYLTVAGLVFVVLSLPYIDDEMGGWGGDSRVPDSFLDLLETGWKEFDDHEVVVLSQVLSAEINVGYEGVVQSRVIKFNGTDVRTLSHLARMVDECRDEFMRFDLDFDVVVVETEDAVRSSAAILETHGIAKPYSLDAPADGGVYKGNLARLGGGELSGGLSWTSLSDV